MVTLLLLTKATNSLAAVGKVTELTGPTEIVRDKKSIPGTVNTGIEMNDTIITAKSKTQLTFQDDTTVKITEQSKLVVDDFVYDPKNGSGKLAMKVVLGTARYASGQIAKSTPQNVSVKTPTANIAVRGTDFSMTVDELGRSLIMLLPSCDKSGCITGVIEVSNDTGIVILDVPYQATMVLSTTTPPTRPTIVDVDQLNINNMLIISRPAAIDEEVIRIEKTSSELTELDVDFLIFRGLDQNQLDEKRELDINYLDVDLLATYSLDFLEADNKTRLENQLDNNILPNYNESTGLKYIFSEDKGHVTLYKLGTSNAYITLNTTKNVSVNINQEGFPITQLVNKGGNTVINIIQK
jgi:hypothetical protein